MEGLAPDPRKQRKENQFDCGNKIVAIGSLTVLSPWAPPLGGVDVAHLWQAGLVVVVQPPLAPALVRAGGDLREGLHAYDIIAL